MPTYFQKVGRYDIVLPVGGSEVPLSTRLNNLKDLGRIFMGCIRMFRPIMQMNTL